ncbi:lactate utilization protein [Desulfonema ishimotonii]|uniref:Lactate utilization protein n=1 Tax=Desulfonema ishimotonii TaxID=45657 RepID=A0A401FXH8_9BACT|nr:lactate utilization protein [Desulfonema ishimotonii]GBC61656.1 lactate utilization protein [Desulfonema ishimotonii]
MTNPTTSHQKHYWTARMTRCKEALEKNNFTVYLADTAAAACQIALETVIPAIRPGSFSWGDSLTYFSTGLPEILKQRADLRCVETFAENVSREEIMERRRQALLVDLFITGTNAVTESGKLVNLDMVGNRVAGITFGPKHVLLFIGRNKIVADTGAAMARIKHYAAPVNAIRHDCKTPCVKTGTCMDCKSPDRICNTWTITEKSYPEGRIQVILINEDLGL